MSHARLRIAAVRLGRLGDLVMTLPALQHLASRASVTLVTDDHHQPIFRSLLPELTVEGPDCAARFDGVLDLHGGRGRVVARRLAGGAPLVHTDKETVGRRGLLAGPVGAVARRVASPRRTWPERHLRAAHVLLTRLGLTPGEPPEPIPRLPRPASPPGAPILGLGVGARHANKRWPLGRWAALAEAWTTRAGGDCVVFAAPWEADAALLADLPGVRLGPAALVDVPAALGNCGVVVANDTGPLHLAGALGVPVVGLFGPTPVDAGFWVWGAHGRALPPSAACSPCSMHGAPTCPRPPRRCLEEHSVEEVFAAALGLARGDIRRVG